MWKFMSTILRRIIHSRRKYLNHWLEGQILCQDLKDKTSGLIYIEPPEERQVIPSADIDELWSY